jgi:hypothetical protein
LTLGLRVLLTLGFPCLLRVSLSLGFHVFEGIIDSKVSCLLRVFLSLGFHVFEGVIDIRVSCA